MDIAVYLNRPHKDPDDVTGKATLLTGAYCRLPEAEAELWINHGWAKPVDREKFQAHLEAKVAAPLGYARAQEESVIQAKAASAAACAKRKEDRPNLAELAKRKAELREASAAERAEAAKAQAGAEALRRAAGMAGGQLTPTPDEKDDE